MTNQMTIKELATSVKNTRPSDETISLILDVMDSKSNTHPEEVIRFLSQLSYSFKTRIAKEINLFQFLLERFESLRKTRSKEAYQLFESALSYNEAQIYGQEVTASVGNRGRTYKGFQNDLYSNPFVDKNGTFHLTFQLHIDVSAIKTLELGKSLGVSEKTLRRLHLANEKTEFLALPKNRKNATNLPAYLRTFEPVDMDAEQEFHHALTDYAKEMNGILTKKHPSFTVKTSTFFETRSNIDTDYSLCIEKSVPFTTDYRKTQKELIETIRAFHEIENNYFGIEVFANELIDFKREQAATN